MKFPTQFDKDTSKYSSPTGSPYLDEYEYRVDKKGVKELVKKDTKINVQDKIQADYPSTDINLLMKRFALGDTSAIDINKGFYGDFTDMPKTYAELFDRVEAAKAYFDELPADLKAMFDNSYTQFYSEMDSKGFIDKIDKYNDRFVNHDFDEVSEKTDTNIMNEVEYHE